MSSRAPTFVAAAAVLVAGCAVGPNFERPTPPSMQAYDTPESSTASDTATAAATAAAAADSAHLNLAEHHNTPDADVPGQWWRLFQSPVLDQMLQQALADNPTLTSANATLAAAREAIIVARAGLLPQLGASAGVQRAGGSSQGGGSSFGESSGASSLYSVGLNASYSVDAFGGTRRLVEQQRSLAELQRYQLAAAYLSLTGNVVTEALTIASTRAQLDATYSLLADDEKNLKLTQREYEAGAAARTDVLTAEGQLASDQTTLLTLQQQLSAPRHPLALLVGRTPGEWSAPEFDLRDFTLPEDLPVSLPSALV